MFHDLFVLRVSDLFFPRGKKKTLKLQEKKTNNEG